MQNIFYTNYPVTVEDVDNAIAEISNGDGGWNSSIYDFSSEYYDEKAPDPVTEIVYTLGVCIIDDEILFLPPSFDTDELEDGEPFYQWYGDYDPVIEQELDISDMPNYLYGPQTDKIYDFEYENSEKKIDIEELDDFLENTYGYVVGYKYDDDYIDFDGIAHEIRENWRTDVCDEVAAMEDLTSENYRKLCANIAQEANDIFENYKKGQSMEH